MTVKDLLARINAAELTEWAIWMDIKYEENKKALADAQTGVH